MSSSFQIAVFAITSCENECRYEPLGLVFCIIYGTGLGIVKRIEHKPV